MTWITLVERSPLAVTYVPQMGDTVMYFYQGHEISEGLLRSFLLFIFENFTHTDLSILTGW